MSPQAVKQVVVTVKPFDGNQVAESVSFFDKFGNSWGQDRASSADLDNVFAIATGKPTYQFEIISNPAADFVMTNATLAERAAGGAGARVARKVPTGCTKVRLVAQISTLSASTGTPKVALKYKTGAYSATIGSYLPLTASGLSFSVFTGAPLEVDTGWVDMVSGAIGSDINVLLTELGGDAVADPALAYLYVMFK